MGTKLSAARIATSSGADMIIANAADVRIIHRIMTAENTVRYLRRIRAKNLIW